MAKPTPRGALIAVAALDALVAISPVLYLNDIGMVSACAQFALFGSLAIGIWRLKKWAWLTEIALSAIQVTLLVAGAVTFAIVRSDSILDSSLERELIAFVVALLALNGYVLWVLLRSDVRVQFTQVTS